MKVKTYTLSELATIKYGKNQKKVASDTGTIPIYGTGGLMGYAIKSLYDKPSVLIGRKGTIDKVRYIEEPFWTVDTLFYTEINTELVIPRYLYYVLSLLDLSQYNEGTTIPSLRTETLNRLEFNIPSIKEQRRILSFIVPIEDKIELNNKINNNLAEQSQAILKKYMDDFEYTLTPLGEFANIIDCLHSKKPDMVDNTTKQLLQLNNITDTGFLDLSSKYYISEADYENWTRKCEIVEGDCVITNVGRIGAVSQAPVGTHAAMGRNMTCIRLKNDKPYFSFLITALLSNHIRREIMKNTDEGTIMGALNVKNIPLLQFPIFSSEVMNTLEESLYPIRKAIEQNYLANQKLSDLRDTLLPKLMSGTIDLSSVSI